MFVVRKRVGAPQLPHSYMTLLLSFFVLPEPPTRHTELHGPAGSLPIPPSSSRFVPLLPVHTGTRGKAASPRSVGAFCRKINCCACRFHVIDMRHTPCVCRPAFPGCQPSDFSAPPHVVPRSVCPRTVVRPRRACGETSFKLPHVRSWVGRGWTLCTRRRASLPKRKGQLPLRPQNDSALSVTGVLVARAGRFLILLPPAPLCSHVPQSVDDDDDVGAGPRAVPSLPCIVPPRRSRNCATTPRWGHQSFS